VPEACDLPHSPPRSPCPSPPLTPRAPALRVQRTGRLPDQRARRMGGGWGRHAWWGRGTPERPSAGASFYTNAQNTHTATPSPPHLATGTQATGGQTLSDLSTPLEERGGGRLLKYPISRRQLFWCRLRSTCFYMTHFAVRDKNYHWPPGLQVLRHFMHQ